MNLLRAVVNDTGAVAAQTLEIALPDDVRAKCGRGQGIVVGIVAEDSALDFPERHAEARTRCKARWRRSNRTLRGTANMYGCRRHAAW